MNGPAPTPISSASSTQGYTAVKPSMRTPQKVGLAIAGFLLVALAMAVGLGAGQLGTTFLWSRLATSVSYSSVETTYDAVQEFNESIEVVDLAWRRLGDTDHFGQRITFKYTVRNLTDENITINSWRSFIPVFVDADGFALHEAATGGEFIVPANGEYTHTGVEHIETELFEQIVDLRLLGR